MEYERIDFNGRRYAEVIRATATVTKSVFISPPESSMQFGLLAHEAGFVEGAHWHHEIPRTIDDLQQMFVVQRGIVAVDFFEDDGRPLGSVELHPGDAILLIHGAHSVRVIEDMQCVSVKQGPFLGVEKDKVEVKSK
jgi:hypothetical protein